MITVFGDFEPTPTPTSIPVGNCQHSWFSMEVDSSKYGIRYKSTETGQYVTTRLTMAISTANVWRNGKEGYVVSVCSQEVVNLYNLYNNTIVSSIDGFERLASGGSCSYDAECSYDAPNPTPTLTPTLTPTPTTVVTGNCQHSWFSMEVHPNRYGLRYKSIETGQYIQERLNQMISTANVWRNGKEGYVVSVCTQEVVNVYDFNNNAIVSGIDGFERLASGGSCTSESGRCSYDAPNPTATPTPTPTPTPTLTPTLTPTATPDCLYYTLVPSMGETTATYRWISCGGTTFKTWTGLSGDQKNVCAKYGTVTKTSGNGSIYAGSECELPPPSPTPTATPIPTPHPPTPSPTPFKFPTPTPTTSKSSGGGSGPVLTPTPTPTATPTIYVYQLSSCNSEQANVTAKSTTQKTIGGKYELTGSSYQSGAPWTILRRVYGSASTWIGNVTRDACESGECLLEGTQIKLPNGTSTQIETLKIGDTLASNNIGNMPNTDNVIQLLTWEETDPLVSSTTTTIVGIELNTVTRVLNFNQGLLTSTVAHLHIIKRDNLWMVTQAINIKEGDIFIDDSGTEHIINSIEDMSGTFNTYKIDVEENDTYIANNIITHNRKLEDPV